MAISIIRRTIALCALVAVAAGVSLVAAGPASAGTSDWVLTSSVSLGSCTSTKNLAPGLYMQVCTRILDRVDPQAAIGGTAQSYAVFTNTGTTAHWIHVAEPTQYFIATYPLVAQVVSHQFAVTGDCGTTLLWSGGSLTCKSLVQHWEGDTGPTMFSNASAVTYGIFRLEYDGKTDGVRSTPTLSF